MAPFLLLNVTAREYHCHDGRGGGGGRLSLHVQFTLDGHEPFFHQHPTSHTVQCSFSFMECLSVSIACTFVRVFLFLYMQVKKLTARPSL